MKRFTSLAIFLLLFILASCQEQKVEESTGNNDFYKTFPSLEVRDGRYYKLEADAPYTGTMEVDYDSGQISAVGTFEQGKLNGQLALWYLNGQKLRDSHYDNGVLNGLWETWYPSGNKNTEIRFVKGKRDGVATAWYENGQKKMEANYSSGELNGMLTVWNEIGEIISKKEYEGDKPVEASAEQIN